MQVSLVALSRLRWINGVDEFKRALTAFQDDLSGRDVGFLFQFACLRFMRAYEKINKDLGSYLEGICCAAIKSGGSF